MVKPIKRLGFGGMGKSRQCAQYRHQYNNVSLKYQVVIVDRCLLQKYKKNGQQNLIDDVFACFYFIQPKCFSKFSVI